MEGLHKNNSSRGTDTAKHKGITPLLGRHPIHYKQPVYPTDCLPDPPNCISFSSTVASGASGSFSTNSPASPLSSVSFTSPLSPFSPVPGSQVSPTKQLGPEVSTGHTQPRTNPCPNPNTGPGTCSNSINNPEVRIRSGSQPRPKSCIAPHFQTDPDPRCRPKSHREPDTSLYDEHNNAYDYDSPSPQLSLTLQNLEESYSMLDTVLEESDQNLKCRTRTNFDQAAKHTNKPTSSDHQERRWSNSNVCSQEVKVGLRKDVHPSSHPYHFSTGNNDGLRNLTPNKRFSVPVYQILFLQD